MLTYEEVETSEDRKDPKATVRLFIRVLNTLSADKDAALEMIPLFFPKTSLAENATKRSGFALLASDTYLVQQLLEKPHIMRSYLGGTPENGYAVAPEEEPVFIEGKPTVIGEKEAKIFVRSGGKDNPTPVGLKKNKDGVWKVFNWSSLATGVKKTVAEADDF